MPVLKSNPICVWGAGGWVGGADKRLCMLYGVCTGAPPSCCRGALTFYKGERHQAPALFMHLLTKYVPPSHHTRTKLPHTKCHQSHSTTNTTTPAAGFVPGQPTGMPWGTPVCDGTREGMTVAWLSMPK